MGDFNRNRSSSRGSFGGGNRFGGSNSYGNRFERFESNRNDDREMFDAVCDQCGRDCQVPFKPSSNKPVLCNTCFRGKDNNNEGQFERRDNSRSFRSERPDFGSKDIVSKAPVGFTKEDYLFLKNQVEYLHIKLDKVLKALENKVDVKASQVVAPKSEVPDKSNNVEAVPTKVRKPRKTVSKKKSK